MASVCHNLAGPILEVAHILLSTVLSSAQPGPGQAAPLFTLAALNAAPGSGAAMDDWLQAAVAGGDAGERAEEDAEDAAAAVTAEEEEEKGGEVVSATSQLVTFEAAESEADVYVRQAESFLARAVGTFSSELLPLILRHSEQGKAVFLQACEQLAVCGRASPSAAAALAHVDIVLRLLARAGPFLHLARVEEPAARAPQPGERLRGAHGMLAFAHLTQLGALWLQALQHFAAAGPSTPAAGQSGQPSSLAAILQVGARIHKCLGALSATWLPQLMMARASEAADPAAHACLASLVDGLLSTASQLHFALLQLPSWQGVLHPVALAAAESLVSLSSITLSSSMKPPESLLQLVAASSQLQVGADVVGPTLRLATCSVQLTSLS